MIALARPSVRVDRRPAPHFDSVKTFSATLASERNELGERITAWLTANNIRVVDAVVSQSSDAAYHCLTITIFYWR